MRAGDTVRSTRSATLCALALSAAGLLLLGGCTSPTVVGDPLPVPEATSSPSTPSTADPEAVGPVMPSGEARVVAEGLDLPWSMVRVSAGPGDGDTDGDTSTGSATTLVSERDTAKVKEVSDEGDIREVGTVPGVVPGGEGGLLGLAVYTGIDPETDSTSAPETTWLYAYITTDTDNRIIRMPLNGASGNYTLGEVEPLVIGINKAGNHNGGRLKFGPDGMLYATTGDAGDPDSSQDQGSLNGKILRMTPEGEVPTDNPFLENLVYSMGHRNPQGLAWDRAGRLWAAEFGQNTWDELNLITAGANYGWPTVEGISDDPDLTNPVYQWATSEASPSGLLWTHDTFFLAALRGERLWTITASPESVTADAYFAGEFGRLRDVIDGPDDTIWILTNNTGRAPRDGDDKILEVRLGALDKG